MRSTLLQQHGQRSSRAAWRGFSLLELVMVIIIISVLGAVAAPRYLSSLAHYRVDAAANRIAADLELARQSARAASASRTVMFNSSTHAYLLQDVDPLDPQDSSYAVDLSIDPYHSTIVTVDFGGKDAATFNGYGLPQSGGSITIQAGDHTRTVVLDPDTGETKIS